MKLVSTLSPPRKPSARTFATVTTTSGLNAIQIAIGMERRRTPFQVVPVMAKEGLRPSFDLRADPTNLGAAIDTVRSLLGSLMDAADRGMLSEFEVTAGADLVRRIPSQ